MNMATDPAKISPLTELLQHQRASYLAAPNPDYAIRKERLMRLKAALLSYQQPLVEALSQDYGHRSVDDSLISDIMPVVNNINYSLKNLKKWLKPSRRHAGILLAPRPSQSALSATRRYWDNRALELPRHALHWAISHGDCCGQPCHAQTFGIYSSNQ